MNFYLDLLQTSIRRRVPVSEPRSPELALSLPQHH